MHVNVGGGLADFGAFVAFADIQAQRERAVLEFVVNTVPTSDPLWSEAIHTAGAYMGRYGPDWGRTPGLDAVKRLSVRASTGEATPETVQAWLVFLKQLGVNPDALIAEVHRLTNTPLPPRGKGVIATVIQVARSIPAATVAYNPVTATFTVLAKTGVLGSKVKTTEAKLYSTMEHHPIETVAAQAAVVGAGFAIGAAGAGAITAAATTAGGKLAATGAALATVAAQKKAQEVLGLSTKPTAPPSTMPVTPSTAAAQAPTKFFSAGTLGSLPVVIVVGSVIGIGAALFKPSWFRKGR